MIETQDDGSYKGCDYSLDGSIVTFEGITINTDRTTYAGTTLWVNKDSMSRENLNVVVDNVDVY